MEKVIPEVKQYFCDRCEKEVGDKGEFDCSGSVHFVYRDFSGHAVNGSTKKFDLCFSCSADLQRFFKNECARD